MTDEEKKEMMSNMMPKMMGQMMGGGGGNPMMGMMSMMMGKKGDKSEKGSGKMPWDNCMEMMAGFKETASSAKFATPELRALFEEWCEQLENEILDYITEKKEVNITDLSNNFNLSEESIKYLANKLTSKGKLNYKV